MPVRMHSPLKNLRSVDLGRDGMVQFDKVIVPGGIPSTCRDLNCTVTYTDNFNRPDAPGLGVNWDEWFTTTFVNAQEMEIVANQLRLEGKDFPFPGAPSVSLGAYKTFPVGTTDQVSKMIFGGISVTGIPHFSLANYVVAAGGPAVRIRQVGIGNGMDTNADFYCLYYQEQHLPVAPFARTSGGAISLWVHRTTGLNNPASFVYPVGQFLEPGDELKLTAMNFNLGGNPAAPRICLKGYVNDVLKINVTVIANGALGLITGRAGIADGPTATGVTGFSSDWDNWEGCEAVPV